jgi:SAM-dependent methyltransferase
MTVTQESPTVPPPTVQTFGMWLGVLVTQMLRVAGDHEIWPRLLDGPRTSAQLARATGTDEPSLHRLLRALAGLGLLSRQPQGWALTPLGVAAGDLGRLTPWADAVYDELGRAVETGTPAMTFSHGCTLFEYLAQHPDDAADFDRIMALINAGEPQAVAEAYDFAGVERVVDVGGGNGTLLAEMLRRRPALRGVLFDVPETVDRAVPELRALAARCETVGGDFFHAVPSGADAYVLSHIVHDWPETQILSILARIREAIAPEGRLLIVESVMPADDTPHPARMLDMLMLMLTGGRERTEAEYAELLERAGFRLARVIPTRSPVSVIEAFPAE